MLHILLGIKKDKKIAEQRKKVKAYFEQKALEQFFGGKIPEKKTKSGALMLMGIIMGVGLVYLVIVADKLVKQEIDHRALVRALAYKMMHSYQDFKLPPRSGLPQEQIDVILSKALANKLPDNVIHLRRYNDVRQGKGR